MTKKSLPIGVQSFRRIIEEDFIYIDKTRHIQELTKKGLYFFLSRPRRFGKTLLCTTLEQLFLGNKKLFINQYIGSSDYNWEEYPVVFISFATMAPKSAETLRHALEETIYDVAQRGGISLKPSSATLGTLFKALILALAKKNKVVILIDEYDAAILKNIENTDVANECREVLSDFFSALKDGTVDDHLRFVFITGITKFSKTSIFSGLNNLQDLSLDQRAATLLGYTKDEIFSYYHEYLGDIAQETGESLDSIVDTMQSWYNGYLFCDPATAGDARVYNPYSVMLYLQNKTFDNYWFDTGTPSFLMRLIETQNYPIITLEGAELHKDETKSYEVDQIELMPLLMQTGYLTIKSYDRITENYTLTFPNLEVKNAFFQFILIALTDTKKSLLSKTMVKLKGTLKKAELEKFFEALQVYFSQFPYHLHVPMEKHYQAIFFGIMALLGATIRAEEATNDGRIDAVLETHNHIILFEFKVNAPAKEALKQIEEKKYYQKYLHTRKTIILVGVSFDTSKRNIDSWVTKELSS